MQISFAISSPAGDRPADAELLSQPFVTGPGEHHAVLTLGHYFAALRAFVLGLYPGGRTLADALSGGEEPSAGSEARIRSEKHGALYHIASVTLLAGGVERGRFCVTTALPAASSVLEEEYRLLHSLGGRFSPSPLPAVYHLGKVTLQEYPQISFTMALGEWLDDFHEWHLSRDPADGCRKIILWDYRLGNRFLSEAQGLEIYRQCSTILARFYDPESGLQITPWHHAAGDFIARALPSGEISVRLITVRGRHRLLASAAPANDMEKLGALLFFFLDTTLRMRLDRLDGIGERAWADKKILPAVVDGFRSGMADYAAHGNSLFGFLSSLTVDELLAFYEQLVEDCEEIDADEGSLVRGHLQEHAESLLAAVRAASV